MSQDTLTLLRTAMAECRKVTIDDTLHLHHPGVPGLDAKIKAALARGATVTENGVSQWLDFHAVMDRKKSGTDRYTWDSTGNKVKVEKFLVTKDGAGKVTKKSIGFAFKDACDHI